MAHTSIYIELASMIEKNWIVKSLSEFDQQLQELENDGQFTTEEHKFLLKLYIEKFRHED